MSDALREIARHTNHGAGRGWDFAPAKPRRYPVHLIKASAILLAGCAVIAALWICL